MKHSMNKGVLLWIKNNIAPEHGAKINIICKKWYDSLPYTKECYLVETL